MDPRGCTCFVHFWQQALAPPPPPGIMGIVARFPDTMVTIQRAGKEPEMPTFKSPLVPLAAITTTVASMLASVALASDGGGPGVPSQCYGYCSGQATPACQITHVICCCDIGGTWTCVCRLATDCTTQNNCQP